MYNASCNGDTANPKLFTSYTVGTKVDAGLTGTSGAITVNTFNPETGAVEVESTHHFPECRSMHGIAAGKNCGLVAALCRIENTAQGADYDPIASHTNSAWLTNENVCGNTNKMNDHMWLYEWPDGDLSKTPTKIIVHKSIGSWEYGSDYLRFGENDNSYGIGLKTTVGAETDCHEADSYMILDRNNYSFMKRGWHWACATGHTIQNRPAFDETSKQYAMLCSTDWNAENTPDEVELAFRMETGKKQVIQHLSRNGPLWIKGGAGPLIPREGGGFIGLFVGESLPLSLSYDDTIPTSIGLLNFDASGAQVGTVQWIAQHETAFYSWPQLAALGGDRYLVGWGEGYHAGSKVGKDEPERNLSLKLPWTYWVMEINGDGKALTSPSEVKNADWGELNEMVSLGDGRVAWTYVPEDRRQEGSIVAPTCNQKSLVHYVYTSANK